VLRQEGLTTALVGVKNPNQVKENLKAVGWQPSLENCEKIEKIFESA
jgi:aryl-alcohol dehydrogenase-like predicted oxidoreductase